MMCAKCRQGSRMRSPSSRKGWSLKSCFGSYKVKSADFDAQLRPVFLNVYDLSSMNAYGYWAGLGVFHSGVEVDGIEYAFGGSDSSDSGIVEVTPRQCPGFTFKKSIRVGMTSLDPTQVKELIEREAEWYGGDMYHLIYKNCNHFSEEICYKLTGKKIPQWVNRLAKLGSRFKFLLPKPLRHY